MTNSERSLLRQDEVEMLERVNAATEGPWVNDGADRFDDTEGWVNVIDNPPNVILVKVPCEFPEDRGHDDRLGLCGNASRDAEFIAHARTDVPTLLSRLAAARAGERWIAVTERLPEDYERVDVWLVVHPAPSSFGLGDSWREIEVWRELDKWLHYSRGEKLELRSELITHWCPLPILPVESQPVAESETK